ncbi:hypothetical protein SH528x_004407 [Novipirellula sp. SH528]|uniref:hypothetical protein n=1 Tax=Novipirellula sp. SH528 TaxID=3454466 RepID=UPI003F9F71B4
MLESLTCNSCGAPMQVPESARFVKCNHCGAQLAVRRERDVTFTEAVDKLTETTQSLSDQVSQLTKNQEIANLDRRWETKRRNFMITGKNGNSHLPTEGGAVVGGIIAIVFGGFWTAMAFSITSHGPSGLASIFPLFGFVFIAVGIFSAIHANKKASEYKQAKRRYEQERSRLRRK